MHKKDAEYYVKYCFFMLLLRIIDNKGTKTRVSRNFSDNNSTFLYAVIVNLSVSKIDYNLLKTKDEEYDSNYFVFKLKY